MLIFFEFLSPFPTKAQKWLNCSQLTHPSINSRIKKKKSMEMLKDSKHPPQCKMDFPYYQIITVYNYEIPIIIKILILESGNGWNQLRCLWSIIIERINIYNKIYIFNLNTICFMFKRINLINLKFDICFSFKWYKNYLYLFAKKN